ncbi:MAG: alpha/beta hydrolase family protein [Thiobacillaceae bacterium]
MRIQTFCLLCLAVLGIPNWTSAQQQDTNTSSDKKAEAQTGGQANPAPPTENWAMLGDLKTGLYPGAADVLAQDDQPDFVRELVRVQWRVKDPIDLWITRPKAAGKVPVVLYLYNFTDGSDRFHDNGWCKRATAGGFAAVGFISALSDYRFSFRPMKQWFVSELPESMGSTVHDVQLILNYLADRGDMDMDRVGMFGMGSGATIAILAAHAEPRIKTLDVLDPWGDWPDWLAHSPMVPEAERAKYTTPEFLKSVATFDPVAYLPTLKTRNLRLQQTLSDAATPKTAKERLAAAIPNQRQVVKYENAEDLFKAWKANGVSGWIKQQMLSQKPPAVAMSGQ